MEHLREHFKEHFMEHFMKPFMKHFMKHFNEYFTKVRLQGSSNKRCVTRSILRSNAWTTNKEDFKKYRNPSRSPIIE